MKKILVSVDLSSATFRVCAAAADLARSTGGQLVILHAPPSLSRVVYGFDTFTAAQVVSFDRKARKSAAHKMQALQHWFNKSCPGTKVVLHEGAPANVILKCARRINADYIVMGSHGHGAMYDLIVGSTARETLRKSTCPVVLVPITKETGKIRPKPPFPAFKRHSWVYD